MMKNVGVNYVSGDVVIYSAYPAVYVRSAPVRNLGSFSNLFVVVSWLAEVRINCYRREFPHSRDCRRLLQRHYTPKLPYFMMPSFAMFTSQCCSRRSSSNVWWPHPFCSAKLPVACSRLHLNFLAHNIQRSLL